MTNRTSNKKILITDNSGESLNLFGKRLRSEGYNILTAIDGKQSFAIAQNKLPDLILIEATVPGINGFELCRAIRKTNSSLNSVALIIMGENTDPLEIEKAFAAGADGYISKKLNIDEIVVKIQSVLKQKNQISVSNNISENSAEKTILLIEDNDLNQNYIVAIMQDIGYLIDIADNGGLALEKFLVKKYDLILTDINVPVINGIEFAKIIRSKYSQTVPIIAISGHSEKELINKCYDAGMNEFITKPFTAKDLKLIINKVFSVKMQVSTKNIVSFAYSNDSGIKKYDYRHALEMAKGDDELFEKWFIRFKEIIKNALTFVDFAIESNEFPERNKPFHELMNYSGYFGLEELASYIKELNSIQQIANEKDRIKKFYTKIKDELENISAFYNGIKEH